MDESEKAYKHGAQNYHEQQMNSGKVLRLHQKLIWDCLNNKSPFIHHDSLTLGFGETVAWVTAQWIEENPGKKISFVGMSTEQCHLFKKRVDKILEGRARKKSLATDLEMETLQVSQISPQRRPPVSYGVCIACQTQVPIYLASDGHWRYAWHRYKGQKGTVCMATGWRQREKR